MVDVEISKRVGDEPQARDAVYSMYFFIGAVAPQVGESWNSRATTPESVREQLLRCSSPLREYCMSAVQGDDQQFEQARIFAKEMRERQDVADRAVWERRKEANAAWRRRDYETTRRLLENLGGDLDDDERERLAWIRSRGS